MKMSTVAAVIVGVLVIFASIGLGFAFRSNAISNERNAEVKAARAAALVNYRNSLTGCETRGNESREDTFALAMALSKAQTARLAHSGKHVVRRMRKAEFARSDGTIRCARAITKP